MHPSIIVAVEELKQFAEQNYHKPAASSYMKKWMSDLMQWEYTLKGNDFPASKLYKLKKYIYTRYK